MSGTPQPGRPADGQTTTRESASGDTARSAGGGDAAALREEIEALRERVAELESHVATGSSTLPPAASDYRDARVLEALDQGETVPLRKLRELYLDLTDVRESDTLRKRIKTIAESEAFEKTGQQRWKYVGSGQRGH